MPAHSRLGLGALAGGSLFILRELVTPFPAVNLRLFRLPAFGLLCVAGFLSSVGSFGALFMVPIFLQQVIGLTPLQAGLILVPAIIVSGVNGVLVGRLSDLVSPPLLVVSGLIALTVLFYGFASFTPLTTVGVLVGYIVLYRICMHAVHTPLTVLNVQIFGADQVRMAQGLLGVARSIGASLGVTLVSVFFERRRVSHQLLTYATYDAGSFTHEATLHELKRLLQQNGLAAATASQAALRIIRRQMDIEAIAAGFRDSFLLVGLCFLLASIPAWCLSSQRWLSRENQA